MRGLSIPDAVVIVTGISSGIGRATAIQLATRGASVVLVTRQNDAAHKVARLCEENGGQALAVPVDVTDEQAVLDVAERAVERFGKIDGLVNNAAVSVFGRIEEIPMDVFRRVLETNVIGYVHCVRAVLPHMRESDKGVIVNVSSVVAIAPQPFTIPYSLSKCADSGLTDALRMELRETPGIHVCSVLPPSVDTPVFQHAGNYSGWDVEPMEPVYPAERVARTIVRCLESPRREVSVGAVGPFMKLLQAVAPSYGERFFSRQVRENHLTDQPKAPTPGNIFEPDTQHNAISGGWLKDESKVQARRKPVFQRIAVTGGRSSA